MRVDLRLGDCRDVMPTISGADAIVTDPPYGLKFMGKGWDHGVPGAEFWKLALAAVKPGAHLVAFGGTRTYHRLACAIEDSGWEIRDCLMWLYGSGFPKSLDISKAIDKAAGETREREPDARSRGIARSTYAQDKWTQENYGTRLKDGAITDAAGAWEGWGTALKPAWEPIILARKPIKQTVASNVLEHGTGGINIDACRIAVDANDPHHRPNPSPSNRGANSMFGSGGHDGDTLNAAGRWPANIVLDEEAAAALDEQSGEAGATGGREKSGGCEFFHGGDKRAAALVRENDSGGASRFFYTSKASRAERNAGLDGMPEQAPRTTMDKSVRDKNGGDTGYTRANHHPTVKPLDLMQWLCKLVTPKGGVILDPFMGSGSTGRAAVAEGFAFIGIDEDAEYLEIAKARIAEYAPLFAETGT